MLQVKLPIRIAASKHGDSQVGKEISGYAYL